jgi:hypothetical protein
LGGAVHGQATVPNGSGGYRTVEFQVGKATSVSSSSITVSSADGFAHTYAVVPSSVVDSQAGGISTVAKGDQVRVIGSTESGKDTAVNIVDTTKVGNSRKGFGFGGPKAKQHAAPGSGAAAG